MGLFILIYSGGRIKRTRRGDKGVTVQIRKRLITAQKKKVLIPGQRKVAKVKSTVSQSFARNMEGGRVSTKSNKKGRIARER